MIIGRRSRGKWIILDDLWLRLRLRIRDGRYSRFSLCSSSGRRTITKTQFRPRHEKLVLRGRQIDVADPALKNLVTLTR